MSFTVLVLHGPNLHWLGCDEVDERLEARASELGVDLSIVQSNGEGALIDELHEQEDEYDAVIVNPGSLAPQAWALAEALQLVGVPAVEVLLNPILPERGLSALTSVVRQQIHGKGHDGYLHALEAVAGVRGPSLTPAMSAEMLEEHLAEEEEEDEAGPEEHVSHAAKSIGKRKAEPAPAPVKGGKTLGRRAEKAQAVKAEETKVVAPKTLGRKGNGSPEKSLGPGEREPAPASKGLSRIAVRAKIADRLAKKLAADELAGWARAEWSALQRGAACEEGQRDLLEGVLLTLMAGAKVSEHLLLAQMAKL